MLTEESKRREQKRTDEILARKALFYAKLSRCFSFRVLLQRRKQKRTLIKAIRRELIEENYDGMIQASLLLADVATMIEKHPDAHSDAILKTLDIYISSIKTLAEVNRSSSMQALFDHEDGI